MSAFDLKKDKRKKLEDLWNSSHRKVLIMIIGGRNLPPKAESLVSIRLGDKRYRTAKKKSETPSWGETFYL